MAQPAILSDGATPRRQDTRWRVLVKTVGVVFDAAAAPVASDAPARQDTRHRLLEKWNRIQTGA